MNRRALLATVGVGMASISGCLGSGDESNEFDSYEVTVIENSGDGDLSISAKKTHDATGGHPAVIELSVENQADEERMYREIPERPVPFHFISFDHGSVDDSLLLRAIEDADPTDLDNFDRRGDCWYYDPERLAEAADVTFEPGESTTYTLAVGGQALPEDVDEPDEGRCLPDGEYVGTQSLDEYDSSFGPDFDEEDNHLGEITLELELEISRD